MKAPTTSPTRRWAWLLLALATAVPAAQAQTWKWPERPVRVVVPFPPGGSTDIVARMLTARLSQESGQQFVVDNRAGAAGTIGAEIVQRATPDGHTIIVVPSSYASGAVLYKLPYDPIKDIAPVAMITHWPFVLTVHPSVKAANLKELIELGRAKPGSLTFGSQGTGGVPHLAGELFQQMTNVSMLHVPFKGDSPMVAALLGGQIQVVLAGPLVLSPHIKAGKLRGLAVTSERRSPVMPDLPTIAEFVPGYAALGWAGVWAPPGTPRQIISLINQALERIARQPDFQERLRADGMEPGHSSPGEFADLIARDIATWSRVAKTGNIRID